MPWPAEHIFSCPEESAAEIFMTLVLGFPPVGKAANELVERRAVERRFRLAEQPAYCGCKFARRHRPKVFRREPQDAEADRKRAIPGKRGRVCGL